MDLPVLRLSINKFKAGRNKVDQMGALTLMNLTKKGIGTKTHANEQVKDVTILDIYNKIATVKLVSRYLVDYLHVGKLNGEL